MRLKDVVELIRVDMPDYTEGPFDVRLESDDGGTHITIYVEEPTDGQAVLKVFLERFPDRRIIVMKTPEGFLPLSS